MSPHEKAQPPQFPSLDEVAAAFADITTHNNKHTGVGAALMGMLLDSREANETIDYLSGASEEPQFEPTPETHPDEPVSRHAVEGDMSADLQEILHADTFDHIGIKIVSSGSFIADGTGRRTSSMKLVPLIVKREDYVGFMESVRPEEIRMGRNQHLFTDALRTLGIIIKSGFSTEELADRDSAEEALRIFVAIEPAYKQLGLDAESLRKAFPAPPEEQPTFGDMNEKNETYWKQEAYEEARAAAEVIGTLEAFVHYWGRDVLPEYLVVGELERLEQPQLAYLDMRPAVLMEKVDQIIDMPGAERTQAFRNEAAAAFLGGLEKTLRSIEDNPDAWYASEENRQLIESNMKRLRAAIGRP